MIQTPKFAARASRVAGTGASAWDTHYQALIDQEHDPDVIVLSVGDPDFSTPQPITKAAIKALEHGDTHYTPILGRIELRERIAELFYMQSGMHVTQSNVAVLAGAQNALFTASLCVLDAPDEVICFDPMYLTYDAYLGVSGATIVRLESTRANGFRPNVDALASAVSPNTKAIAFSNPNNPTGVAFTETELQAIAKIAIDHDLWVISDEVYGALTFRQPHISIAALPGMLDRTVTINSLSKSHAMTGWRLGWMIAPQNLIQHVDNMALCMLYGLPGFVQQAGIEALGDSWEVQNAMRDVYADRKDRVYSLLRNIPTLQVFEPQAGMFLLVDVSGTGLNAAEFAHALYEQHKVSVLDGAAFGDSLSQYVRVSFTTSASVLQEACARIAEFTDSLSMA